MPAVEQLQPKRIEATTATLEPHEIESRKKEDLLKRVRTIFENRLFHLGKVENMDSAKAYCWVNQHDEQLMQYQGMGWVISKSKLKLVDGKVQREVGGRVMVESGPRTNWVREDGTHRRGDLILHEIDREMKEALDSYGEQKAVEQLEGSKDRFRAFAERERLPIKER